MKRHISIPSVLALTAVFMFGTSGCRTMETTFGAPKAHLASGVSIDLGRRIPQADPEKVALGEMSIRFDSELLDENGKVELARNLAQVAGGFTSWKTKDKDPEYRVVIHQVNTADEWAGSPMGAVAGAGAGLGVGAAAGKTKTGGGLGAVAGYFAFGKQRDKWLFSITVYRRTTEAAVEQRLDSLQNQNMEFSGGADGASYSLGSSQSGGESNAALSFASDEYPAYFTALLSVDSGTFHSSDKVEMAARKELVERLPRLIFGGDVITF